MCFCRSVNQLNQAQQSTTWWRNGRNAAPIPITIVKDGETPPAPKPIMITTPKR